MIYADKFAYRASIKTLESASTRDEEKVIENIKGSPIKGQVKKKNTSPCEKGFPFLLGHDARISTALF